VGWDKVACWSTKTAISVRRSQGVSKNFRALKAYRTVIFAIAQLTCFIVVVCLKATIFQFVQLKAQKCVNM